MDGQADHQLPTRIDHTHGLIHEFHRPKEIIIFLLLFCNVQILLYQIEVMYKLFGECTNFIMREHRIFTLLPDISVGGNI
jgi:hypothetical protein